MKLGKTLIIGDSYSTFEGFIPEGYHTWYSTKKSEDTDVNDVKQTWWYRLFDGKENILVKNDSFSGTTVCNTVRPQLSADTSFISRFDKMVSDGFFKQNDIDTVIVFGYTNDCWIGVPFGEAKFSGFTKDDLLEFFPACCYLASRINETLPNASVLWLLNTDADKKFPDAVKFVADRFGQKYLSFEKIDKTSGHPNVNGMKQIAQAIEKL